MTDKSQPRFEAFEQCAKQAERVFRRAERGQGSLRSAVGLGASAHRSRLHQRGQFVHRLSEVRVERGLRAEILDRRFKGGDLRRELVGC